MNKYHEPVMLNKSIDALNVTHNGIYVDATFGGGGHSKKILEKLKKGKLYAFDKDGDSNKNFLKDDRFKLFISDYKYITEYLKIENVSTMKRSIVLKVFFNTEILSVLALLIVIL